MNGRPNDQIATNCSISEACPVHALPLRLAVTVEDSILARTLPLNQRYLLQGFAQRVGRTADWLTVLEARDIPGEAPLTNVGLHPPKRGDS